ncbi:MAG: beta strand repeat-containing protein [Planctomyces sp.]|jgi:hypothetical protein
MTRTYVKWLLTAATLATPISALAQTNYPETEPNNIKAAANAVGGASGMVAGDTITGNSTGSSTTVAGTTSADYYLITMRTAAPGIYKHRLAITTAGTAGHTGTIRGNGQTSSGVYATDDAVLQTSIATTTPPRFNDFYGFGKGERLFYRVTGTTTTTADYVATLSTTTVVPTAMSTSVTPGTFAIRANAATNTALDTDLVVLDGAFNVIATRDDPDPSEVSLSLTTGTYYIGISAYNVAVRFPSPTTPAADFPDPVTDFADIVVSTGTSTSTVVRGIEVASGATVVATGAGTPSSQFDIAWFALTVAPPSIPTASSVALAQPYLPGDSVTANIIVNPAATPPSTGITVNADLSAITGVPGTTTFTDIGGNTFSATFTVGATTAAGPYAATVNIADAEARTSTATLLLNVGRNLGVVNSSSAQPTTATTNIGAGQVAWFRFTVPSATSAALGYVDINSLGSLFGASGDTVAAVYNLDGTLRNSAGDPFGGSTAAGFSYGQTSPARTYSPYTTTMTGQTAAVLPAGQYWLGIARQATGWAAGANFALVSPSVDAGQAVANIYSNIIDSVPFFAPITITRPYAGGDSVTLTVTPTPASTPPSTGISVVGDFSAITGVPGTTTFVEGPAGTFTATITLLSSLAPGSYTAPVTVSDAQSRSFASSITLSGIAENFGEVSVISAQPIAGTRAVSAGQIAWFRFVTTQPTNATDFFVDIDTSNSTASDTVAGIYDASGSVVDSADDPDYGTLRAAFSFGDTTPSRARTPYTVNFAGQDGAVLPAGTYYIGVAPYAEGFSFGANFGMASPFTTASTVGARLFTNLPGSGLGAVANNDARPVFVGESYTLSATVFPSLTPPSTLISVQADLSSIGGDNPVSFTEGPTNTFTYTDTLGSIAPGTYLIPFTASDAEGNVANGNIRLIVGFDAGALALGTPNVTGSSITSGGVAWFKITTTDTTGTCRFVDIHTIGSALAPANDTTIAVYNADGTLRTTNDDFGGSLFSALSYGAAAPPRTYSPFTANLVGGSGTLPAGVYYIAVASGSGITTFGAGFSVSSTSVDAGTVSLTGIFGSATGAPSGSVSTFLKGEGLPARTRITSCSGTTAIVKVDASSIGGPAAAVISNATLTTWTGSFAASDSTADGIYTLPFTVEQPAGTVVESGNITVHVRSVTNLGTTDVANSVPPTGLTQTAAATPTGATWFKFTTLEATDASKFVDVATAGSSFSSTATPPVLSTESVMGIWRPDGTLVATNDDWSGVGPSGLSWGQTAPTRSYTGGTTTQTLFDGRTGLTLPAGTYYISIHRYAVGFFIPVGADLFTARTSATDTGTVRAIVGSNLSPSCVSPSIGTPPASLSRLSGQPASFTFTASGTGPLSFQWQKDGSNIVGETGATLTIAAASPADNGAYRVVVTNACGSATSTAATLTVDARCSPADVANTDGDPVSDGTVDNGDFTAFFAAFFLDETDPGRLIADIADTDGATFIEGAGPDGSVDNGDFTAFFTYFFQGCPLPLP